MSLDVLLAGGTGLVGRLVAKRISSRRDVRLESLVRSRAHPGRTVDFEALVDDPASAAGGAQVQVGISCLGTTIRRAGSRSAFSRVDHDYVLAVAQLARLRGATQFILVSSVGAGGRGFYLEVKGRTEDSLRALGFQRLDLIRPSLLLGARAERRPAERLAQTLAPLLDPLLRGPLARYRALDAWVVASAVARLVGRPAPGIHIHHAPDIRELAHGA